MSIISTVYQSGGGHTRVLAEAVARGAASVAGTEAHLIGIRPDQVVNGRWNHEETMVKLAQSDAIVFGCATYMGSVSAIYKAFLEKAFDPWLEQLWKDKTAAGFTNSASQSGDKLWRTAVQQYRGGTSEIGDYVTPPAQKAAKNAYQPKRQVATLIQDIGCEPVDLGELKYARLLEPAAAIVIKFPLRRTRSAHGAQPRSARVEANRVKHQVPVAFERRVA